MTATSTPTPSTQQQQTVVSSPLSTKRPSLSPLKRKLSSISDDDRDSEANRDAAALSPTSLDEVASSSAEERVISPKKKTKTEERSCVADLSKWESRVVASITSSLVLDCIEPVEKDAASCQYEPTPFSAAPASALTAEELDILHHFLA
ncbi:hypothetical protein BBJ28_00006497 [Nothophytophthora sp. Chile5]|nr:hypothetical protein BBJ28_00006497 [Nothophytophthora sp. Chile5]